MARGELNVPLTMEELERAVAESPNNKAPGLDGLPSEVYKQYGDVLIPEYLKVLNQACKSFKFPDSMNDTCIIVLPKPDKDLLTPESYRPISLLNSDVKILARILAMRLGKVIQGLIHPDQSGFTHTRSTATNLRRLYLNMQLPTDNLGKRAILSLDAVKAFNSVEWTYLWEFLVWEIDLYAGLSYYTLLQGLVHESMGI